MKEVTLLVEGGGCFVLTPLEQIVFSLASCPICVFAQLLLTRLRSEIYHQRMEALPIVLRKQVNYLEECVHHQRVAINRHESERLQSQSRIAGVERQKHVAVQCLHAENV